MHAGACIGKAVNGDRESLPLVTPKAYLCAVGQESKAAVDHHAAVMRESVGNEEEPHGSVFRAFAGAPAPGSIEARAARPRARP